MKPQLIVTSVVAIATFALAPMSASAQTEPGALAVVTEESFISPQLDMSPRVHDDWAVVPVRGSLIHHPSAREHEAGPLELDLSPASHDDWAL
jgi:hypothetical protein